VKPTCSVVIATYNRRDIIGRTLDHLAKQTYPADQFEVIVIDDGSPDDTGDVVQAKIPLVPYRLRYLVHQNRGPGATQNRGILEAEGEWIVLMADDILPAPGMLASYATFHRRNPETAHAALGRVLQAPDLPRSAFQDHWDPFRYFELEGMTELPYWKFWACNISVKRSFLLEHGMFRELRGAAHEDVELGYRLCAAGLKILYWPLALAHHYHVETLDAAIKRAYERGLNFYVLTDNLDDPQIVVKYHVFNWRTLREHIAVYRNVSASSLPPADRNFAWLLFRQLIRWVVFNRLTIPVWLSLLRAADCRPWLSRLLNSYFYRGAVSYHFIKGCAVGSARARGRNTPTAINSGRALGQTD
jgi:glycosyltransferase involved in cell wall biosynthesis